LCWSRRSATTSQSEGLPQRPWTSTQRCVAGLAGSVVPAGFDAAAADGVGGALLYRGDLDGEEEAAVALPAAVVAPLPLYARHRSANEEKNDDDDDGAAGLSGFSSCRRGSGREGEGAMATIGKK
jgi:hypothetical protein